MHGYVIRQGSSAKKPSASSIYCTGVWVSVKGLPASAAIIRGFPEDRASQWLKTTRLGWVWRGHAWSDFLPSKPHTYHSGLAWSAEASR